MYNKQQASNTSYLVFSFSLIKKKQDRLEKLKREQFKIIELNKLLEKVEDKLEKFGYEGDSVFKVKKNEEFGGKSSKMVS